jgi:MOB kinase activator 1
MAKVDPKPFRPNAQQPPRRAKLHDYAVNTLGAGSVLEAIRLPKGEDLNEWIDTNLVDFFNNISLFYGILEEFCTKESCPIMNAGPKYEYLWADGVKIKKPIRCSAPEYVAHLMQWVEDQLYDPRVFPTDDNVDFPKNFRSVCKQILKRLFRVYGHIYHSHINSVIELDFQEHLNTAFKHFVYFCKEHRLVDNKEFTPLQDVVEKMIQGDIAKKKKYQPKYKYGPQKGKASDADKGKGDDDDEPQEEEEEEEEREEEEQEEAPEE